MTSPKWTLTAEQIGKGFILAIIGAALPVLANGVTAIFGATFDIDSLLALAWKTGLVAGLSYLAHSFTANSNGDLLQSEAAAVVNPKA
jgi:hypothetical protein